MWCSWASQYLVTSFVMFTGVLPFPNWNKEIDTMLESNKGCFI